MTTVPLKRNVRALKRWINALRHNNLRQTTGRLSRLPVRHRKPGYCCLGVALQYASNRDVRGTSLDWRDSTDPSRPDDKGSRDLSLSSDQRRYFGITRQEMEDLVELNDEARLSFKKIANHIEARILHTDPVDPA